MRNPFRTEADAFRLVLWALAYLGAVALAAGVGGRWAGVGVFAALSLLALAWLVRARRSEPPLPTEVTPGLPGRRRILIVANETLAGDALHEAVRRSTLGQQVRIHVVCPALNSPIRHWVSDEDEALQAAQARLDESLARLSRAGIVATGGVGDSDPLQAIDDALRTVGADELIISTHPDGSSNWLERGIVDAARTRFALPVTHVVVDLAGQRKPVGAASG